jgi:uncharacterized protein YjbI with pentapeptide repeats
MSLDPISLHHYLPEWYNGVYVDVSKGDLQETLALIRKYFADNSTSLQNVIISRWEEDPEYLKLTADDRFLHRYPLIRGGRFDHIVIDDERVRLYNIGAKNCKFLNFKYMDQSTSLHMSNLYNCEIHGRRKINNFISVQGLASFHSCDIYDVTFDAWSRPHDRDPKSHRRRFYDCNVYNSDLRGPSYIENSKLYNETYIDKSEIRNSEIYSQSRVMHSETHHSKFDDAVAVDSILNDCTFNKASFAMTVVNNGIMKNSDFTTSTLNQGMVENTKLSDIEWHGGMWKENYYDNASNVHWHSGMEWKKYSDSYISSQNLPASSR